MKDLPKYAGLRDRDLMQIRPARKPTGMLFLAGVALGMALAVLVLK